MNANWSETIWRISCAAASPALRRVMSKISDDQKGRRKYARYIPSMCASVVGSSTRHQPPLRASLTRLFPRIEQSAAQPCGQRTGQLGRTQLVCACEEPYPAGFNFGKLRPLGLSMQKHTAKIRFDEVDHHASDGYHVFIALISAVAVTIVAILLGFGIEMFEGADLCLLRRKRALAASRYCDTLAVRRLIRLREI
jgi:hypothetical protein